ncbi:Nif3-like dinuclear metal center hexameric protein [Atopobacter phocae]|uniref:Nif3-like dinuclear metal center hexameric protein n=1 Tax=Atopobacter phocae TaxID=136492 RepID=UPI00047284FE|nr:Nif3-like dinuclear metal center hexameric protein [Atopobacter phocae]
MKVADIINIFETHCPQHFKMDRDTIGLQIGDANQVVNKMMITLDIRPSVVQEAIEKKVDFIFAHHPIIYRPLTQIDFSNPQEKMIADLIKHNITVYVAHTNLDVVPGGMNDWFMNALSLNDVKVVHETQRLSRYNISIEINQDDEALFQTIFDTTEWTVRGSMQPIEIEWQRVVDSKNSAVIYQTNLSELYLNDMKHFIHHLEHQLPVSSSIEKDAWDDMRIGLGRVGSLEEPIKYSEFLELLSYQFNWKNMRVVNQPSMDQMIQHIAVIGGDGGKYYNDAIKAGADILITGDLYYHTSHDIQETDLIALDPGHFMEFLITDYMTQWFTSQLNEKIEIIPTQIITDPFSFVQLS